MALRRRACLALVRLWAQSQALQKNYIKNFKSLKEWPTATCHGR